MNVTHDMSVLSLITGASVLVQLVMFGLLLCSLFSWYYIFVKIFTFRRATAQSEKFEKDFWSGGDLNELFQRAVSSRDSAGTMERLFESGFREFTKLRKQSGQNIGAVMDGTPIFNLQKRCLRGVRVLEMSAAFDEGVANFKEAIRQSVQDNPDLANLSHQLILEQTPQGLRISLVDQDGRPMFQQGTAEKCAGVELRVPEVAVITVGHPIHDFGR